MGRFMSPDSLGPWVADVNNPQSWNFYSYVLNNPLINTDPTGHDCVYFNDAGDGIESVDRQDSAQNRDTSIDQQSSDCGKSGGDWINGRISGVAYYGGVFSFNSFDANYQYQTLATAPGADCSGNCDLANGYSQTPNDTSWGATPISSFSMGIIRGVVRQTGPIVNAGNCAAAGALAFSPVVTPDDAEHMRSALTDQGVEGAERGSTLYPKRQSSRRDFAQLQK